MILHVDPSASYCASGRRGSTATALSPFALCFAFDGVEGSFLVARHGAGDDLRPAGQRHDHLPRFGRGALRLRLLDADGTFQLSNMRWVGGAAELGRYCASLHPAGRPGDPGEVSRSRDLGHRDRRRRRLELFPHRPALSRPSPLRSATDCLPLDLSPGLWRAICLPSVVAGVERPRPRGESVWIHPRAHGTGSRRCRIQKLPPCSVIPPGLISREGPGTRRVSVSFAA